MYWIFYIIYRWRDRFQNGSQSTDACHGLNSYCMMSNHFLHGIQLYDEIDADIQNYKNIFIVLKPPLWGLFFFSWACHKKDSIYPHYPFSTQLKGFQTTIFPHIIPQINHVQDYILTIILHISVCAVITILFVAVTILFVVCYSFEEIKTYHVEWKYQIKAKWYYWLLMRKWYHCPAQYKYIQYVHDFGFLVCWYWTWPHYNSSAGGTEPLEGSPFSWLHEIWDRINFANVCLSR